MGCCAIRNGVRECSGGGGGGSTDLQTAYDNSAGASPSITLAGAFGGFVIRDTVAGEDPAFAVEDSAGFEVLGVRSTRLDLGKHDALISTPAEPVVEISDAVNSFEFWPGDRTFTTSPGAVMGLFGSYTYDVPNHSFAALNLQFEALLEENPFAFNHILCFNLGGTVRNVPGSNCTRFGPGQTFISQPTWEADTDALIFGLCRDFLSQPRFQTANGGTLAVTTWSQVQCFGTVDAGVTVTTRTGVQIGALAGAGTVTTELGIDIADLAAGATVVGIRSNVSTGAGKRFIDHQSDAPSEFDGTLAVANGVAMQLGDLGGSGVQLTRQGAGLMRFAGFGGVNDEAVELDLEGTADVAEWSSSSGAGFKFSPTLAANARASIVLGDGLDPDGAGNWWAGWAPGARTAGAGVDWDDVLFSPGANVDLGGNALTSVSAMSLAEPGITLGGGSVVNASTLRIKNAPTEGTALNAALWVESGLARFDGRVDINNEDAIGGGAAATLGQIGGTGPTAAAQATWVEIDVNGVATWVPGFR